MVIMTAKIPKRRLLLIVLLLIAAALVIAYLAFKRTERGKLVLASYVPTVKTRVSSISRQQRSASTINFAMPTMASLRFFIIVVPAWLLCPIAVTL